jgi:hypothetical protein
MMNFLLLLVVIKMKNRNKLPYFKFVSFNRPIKRYYRYVFVKEPEFWYNRKSIEVRIDFLECYSVCDKPKVIGYKVYIVCSSIDDFYMICTIKVKDENEFKKVKKQLFDKMPNNLSMKWLKKHGFEQM